jgi:hypothetical protein
MISPFGKNLTTACLSMKRLINQIEAHLSASNPSQVENTNGFCSDCKRLLFMQTVRAKKTANAIEKYLTSRELLM